MLLLFHEATPWEEEIVSPQVEQIREVIPAFLIRSVKLLSRAKNVHRLLLEPLNNSCRHQISAQRRKRSSTLAVIREIESSTGNALG